MQKIPCDWFLTDGILPPVRLGAPARAMRALVRAGVARGEECLADQMKAEWVMRREWRYFARFDAPAEAGPRLFLALSGLCGPWRARVNGADAAEGDAPFAQFEATGRVKPEGNLIEIIFAPEKSESLAPERGFEGALFAKSAGAVAVCAFEMRFSEGEKWQSLVRGSVTEAGEFEFRYVLEANGAKKERAFREKLGMGAFEVRHEPFARANPGARADITLTVLNGARPLDQARDTEFCAPEDAPLRGFAGGDGFIMQSARRAGGNAVLAPFSPGARMLAAENGVTLISAHEMLTRRAPLACQPYETLIKMAGGDEGLFENGTLWRLSGLCEGALAPVKNALGEGAGDLARLARASRYLQAVGAREMAERARMRRETLIISGARDLRAVCASSALFDANDEARPAYFALMDAWRPEHAFARLPVEPAVDGILGIPVFYVSDADARAATVNARAYSMDGRELVSASFPVLKRATDVVGRLCVELPEDETLLLRVCVERAGECVCQSDALLAPGAGALARLAQTQLLIQDGRLENAGDAIAVGVCAPEAEFFGALLPGEAVLAAHGCIQKAEGLNIIL